MPNSAGAAAMKAFAEFAQHPMELAAFQQTVWLDATKAWVDAWTGESPAVADKRFRDKTWEEDPISRGLRDAHLAVEGAVDKLLDSLPKGSKDHLIPARAEPDSQRGFPRQSRRDSPWKTGGVFHGGCDRASRRFHRG